MAATDRRDFMKKSVATVFTATGLLELLSTALTTISMMELSVPTAKAEPVKNFSNADSKDYPFNVEDLEVNDSKFKLCGVEHDGETAKAWGNYYSDLVANSTCVVNETEPSYFDSYREYNTVQAFWSTVGDLCKKYGKSWFFSDPNTREGNLDGIDLFTAVLGLIGATAMIGPILKSSTRRKFVRNTAFASGLTYLSSSSFFGGLLLKSFTNFELEKFSYDALIDYRNAKVAAGLSLVPQMLNDSERLGDYNLLFMGDAHIKDVRFYMENETVRKLKLAAYLPYDILGNDNDYVRKYNFSDGGWKEVEDRKIEYF